MTVKVMHNHDLLTVEGRLQTFKSFPAKKVEKIAPMCTPTAFANAGFYNTSSKQNPDSVKCFSCCRELANWEAGDDPWEEHIRRQKDCPYVLFHQKQVPTVVDLIRLYLGLRSFAIKSQVDEVKPTMEQTFES